MNIDDVHPSTIKMIRGAEDAMRPEALKVMEQYERGLLTVDDVIVRLLEVKSKRA